MHYSALMKTSFDDRMQSAFQDCLDILMESLRPERALIVYRPKGTNKLEIRARFGVRKDLRLEESDVSLSLIESVLRDGSQLTCLDASNSDQPTLSSVIAGLRSVACAPITHPCGLRIGALYVDDRRVAGRFSSGNGAWMTAQGSVLGATLAQLSVQGFHADVNSWERVRNQALEAQRVGRLGSAERLLREALSRCRKEGIEGLALARALNDLAEIRRLRGDLKEAKVLLDECWTVVRGAGHAGTPEIVPFLNNMAGLAFTGNDFGKAEELFLSALTLLDEKRTRHQELAIPLLCNLGTLYALTGKALQGKVFQKRAAALATTLWGQTDPRVKAILDKLAQPQV